MDAIVTAGGIPRPDELLYPYTLGKPKALLDICGKPMVQWVLDALSGAKLVENVILIGLTTDSSLSCTKSLTFIPNQVGMIENILGGIAKVLEINPSATHVLLPNSDIPAITAEMVDWEIETARQLDVDICYTVAQRETVEARFPGSRRTYMKLRDIEVCGGDMNVVHTSLLTKKTDLWKKIIDARKNPIKQAAIIGLDTLLLVLLRRFTLDQAVKKVTTRLQLTGKAIVCPYAEMAMDVDRPQQLEMLRAYLALRLKH